MAVVVITCSGQLQNLGALANIHANTKDRKTYCSLYHASSQYPEHLTHLFNTQGPGDKLEARVNERRVKLSPCHL